MRTISFSASVALVVLGGCGEAGSPDAGMETPPLTGHLDFTYEEVPIDLSCLGNWTLDEPGPPTTLPLRSVLRAVRWTPEPSVRVRFFDTLTPPADVAIECNNDASCVEVTTGADGLATVELPEGRWFSYHAFGNNDTVGTTFGHITSQRLRRYSETVEPALEISIIDRDIFVTATGTANATPQPNTIVAIVPALDCSDHFIRGAELRVFGRDGEIFQGTESTQTKFGYWDDTGPFPSDRRTSTGAQGLVAAINLPNEEGLRLELWGRRTAGAELERLSCEILAGYADNAIHFIGMRPLRADRAPACD